MKQLGIYCGYGSVVAACLLVLLDACFAQPPSEGSTELPITVKRLTDARLEYHRSDPKLIWSFGKKTFVLIIGGETVPRELIKTLTGKTDDVARIEGTWTLDEEKRVLVLSVIQADGTLVRHTSRLPIYAAGRVRVELGDYQYNVSPGEAELGEADPKLVFKQEGEDLVVTMTIEVPDAPCVVWTHATPVMRHDPHLEGPRWPPQLCRVELSYYVIQCRDDPVLLHRRYRKKKLELSWRVTNHRKSTVPYRVINQFNPSAAELMELVRKLQKLAEETRNRVPFP